jgi:hypothetical protein
MVRFVLVALFLAAAVAVASPDAEASAEYGCDGVYAAAGCSSGPVASVSHSRDRPVLFQRKPLRRLLGFERRAARRAAKRAASCGGAHAVGCGG